MQRTDTHEAPQRCDNTSVGVLITDENGRLLIFERATPPVGLAPVAGHIDQHQSPEQAAAAEVAEEVGLTVTGLVKVHSSWRPNRCRRYPGGQGVGHQWTIYQAQTSGDVTPSPREARDPRWMTRDELQQVTDRTVNHANGRLTAQQFAADPGLLPVWARFLADLRWVEVSDADLRSVNALI